MGWNPGFLNLFYFKKNLSILVFIFYCFYCYYSVYVQLYAQPMLSQDLNNNNKTSTVANLADNMQKLGQIQAMENSPMATFSM